MTTMPTRIDGELFAAAKTIGQLHSRSAAQQIDHWARIGREFEASGVVTHRVIADVLAGRAEYDGLPDADQAVVRATWDERIAETIATLNFEASLRGVGEPWVEADADGRAVMRDPSSDAA